MAVTKEALAIVLDVGKSMNEKSTIILEEAKKCISMIIQRKIFSESKDEIALILFGTLDTENKLHDQCIDEYTNITVVQDLQLASWELLEYVNDVKGTDISTDFIMENALLTAINLLQSGKKFLSQRILFFSCFHGYSYSDKVDEICEAIKMHKIDLNVIGPEEYIIEAPTEDIKDATCMPAYQNDTLITVKAEDCLSKILREVNGESFSFCDVLPALIYYQKKKVQAIPWNANLDIGTNLTIPISAYTKVSESRPKSWKSAYAFKLNAKIEHKASYHVNDEAQTRVTREGIIPAFKYGTTLIPYSEEDKKNMDYQSGEKGMKVLGFTKAENMQRYHYIGDKTMYIFGQKNRELAGVILAPFIHALYDTKMVAIVRYVHSQKSAPKIGFLTPKIKENYECLIYVALPFMEDLRHFVFTPLDSDSKNIPSEEQLNCVDELITAMDLTVPVKGEEDLKPKKMVNPFFQRLYQCLQYRALNPEKPLPGIESHIDALLNPSPKLSQRAESPLKKIKTLFPIKETVAKKQAETAFHVFSNGKSEEPSSKHSPNVDFAPEEKYVPDTKLIEAVTDKIIEVGSVNPVRDFQYLVNNKALPFNDICQQLMDVVVKFLQDNAHLRMYHSKILSICKEFRFASLKEGNSIKYNSFMKNLRNVLLECDEELWDKIRSENIGLISEKELTSSLVSSEQAQMFLTKNLSEDKDSVTVIESFEANADDDYDNLLDQL